VAGDDDDLHQPAPFIRAGSYAIARAMSRSRAAPTRRVGCPTRILLLARAPVLRDLREVLGYGSLLRELVARDLKVRYKRSVLGVVWTMLNPLLLMVILAFVFSHVLRVTVEHFAVYLLSALVLWNFFSQATSWSTACFLSYAPIIKRVYVPRSIFVLATVLAGVVNLLISLVPLALIMLFFGHRFSPALAFLPVPIVLTTLFALGVSLALAPLSVMFADVVPIYQVVLTAWMYVTPVIYPLTALPDEYRRILVLNPMTHLVEAFRTPIYQGAIPSANVLITSTVAGFGTLLIGWFIFRRYSDRVAYLI
jgi:homopolymeric O-antigen transport system permease protein